MEFFSTLKDVEEASDCLFNLVEVEESLSNIAQRIQHDLGDKKPVVLGVMRGALPMFGYLIPRLHFYIEVDYVHATRYQKNLSTGELMWLHEPHISLENRHVLLVDDILDRGITLHAISEKCYELGALDVKLAVLCKKKIANFEPAIEADYIAFTVPDAYIFGYGMD
ncbi:MAG: hypoxanthine-guanine phosphoribosyltransferase, partial [Sphingobacteriales bacterium]